MFPPPLSFLFLFVALNFVFNLSICRMSLRTLLNMMIWLSCCWKPENARKTWKKRSFVLKWSENIVIIDISQVFLTVPVKGRQENVLTHNSADLWLLRCSNWHVCSLFERHQFVSTNRFVWELQAYLNSCCLPQNTTEVFFFVILFPVLVKASLGIFFLKCLLVYLIVSWERCVWTTSQPNEDVKFICTFKLNLQGHPMMEAIGKNWRQKKECWEFAYLLNLQLVTFKTFENTSVICWTEST